MANMTDARRHERTQVRAYYLWELGHQQYPELTAEDYWAMAESHEAFHAAGRKRAARKGHLTRERQRQADAGLVIQN